MTLHSLSTRDDHSDSSNYPRSASTADTWHPSGTDTRAFGFSVMGGRSATNQDAFRIDPKGRWFVVADGMGGYQAGDRASKLAVEVLGRHAETILNLRSDLARIAALRDAFDAANRRILDEAARSADLIGMGTTAVLAVVCGRQLHVASVGDSRAYLVRDERAWQLTVDETIAQLMREAGLYEGRSLQEIPNRHILWNCLGRDEFSGVDPRVTILQPQDRLLLATDGLTGFVDRQELPRVLAQHEDPREAAEHLVTMSRHNGTRDDSTCVAVFL